MSQQGGQTIATCCPQQCCGMFRWNVAIVWPGLHMQAFQRERFSRLAENGWRLYQRTLHGNPRNWKRNTTNVSSQHSFCPPLIKPARLPPNSGFLNFLEGWGKDVQAFLLFAPRFQKKQLERNNTGNRLTDLSSLPSFKPWRTRYEPVNYGISNYWST